jgi:hypothetical protein
MRKLLLLLVAISLVGIAPASAVVKAGASCAKIGATSTVSGKKYTCIKSGKKLIWNKGVVVKKSNSLVAGVCPPPSTADKDPGITQARANTMIGMSEGEAESCANLLNWGYRVGQRDNEIFAGTFDFRVDRVTVTVMNGVISQVALG